MISLSIASGWGDGGSSRMRYERQSPNAVEEENTTLLVPGVVAVNKLGADPSVLRANG